MRTKGAYEVVGRWADDSVEGTSFEQNQNLPISAY
jgi:hypothetical protein